MTHDEYVAAKRILIAELQEAADRIVLLQGVGNAEADDRRAERGACAHTKLKIL